MNMTTIRLRYTQFFIICLFGLSLYTGTQSLSGGIEQFEKNFSNRSFLISNFAQLKLKLGDRVFPQVLVGKDGWLEYTNDHNLDDYQNVMIASPKELSKTQEKLNRLYQELKNRNITLLLVIAPNKATIYPDKLPDEIQKLAPKSNLDIFTDYINENGPPILLDIRPALLDGRKKQDIYYITDTHWNGYGAFIGYQEIMKELSKTYPQLAPKNITDFKIKTDGAYQHDISKIIGTTDLLENGVIFIPKKNNIQWTTLNDDRIPWQVGTTPNKKLPTLLMYIDSFGGGLRNFISPHFSKTTLIQNNSKYPNLLTMNKIDEIHPDIIIMEFVERSLINERLYFLLRKLLSEKN